MPRLPLTAIAEALPVWPVGCCPADPLRLRRRPLPAAGRPRSICRASSSACSRSSSCSRVSFSSCRFSSSADAPASASSRCRRLSSSCRRARSRIRSSALVAAPAVGPLFDLRPRLVVGPLLALQLLVEERRQILALPAGPAVAGAGLLLHHLAPADFRLRLQQPLQRRHLVRQRVAGPLPFELLERPRHRCDRRADRIGPAGVTAQAAAGQRMLRRRTAPGARPRRAIVICFGARLQLRLRLRDRLDVAPTDRAGARSAARCSRWR